MNCLGVVTIFLIADNNASANKTHSTSPQDSVVCLKRHMAVHHQILLRSIIQPDNSALDMLDKPTIETLRAEIDRYWHSRRDADGNYHLYPSLTPGQPHVTTRHQALNIMARRCGTIHQSELCTASLQYRFTTVETCRS